MCASAEYYPHWARLGGGGGGGTPCDGLERRTLTPVVGVGPGGGVHVEGRRSAGRSRGGEERGRGRRRVAAAVVVVAAVAALVHLEALGDRLDAGGVEDVEPWFKKGAWDGACVRVCVRAEGTSGVVDTGLLRVWGRLCCALWTILGWSGVQSAPHTPLPCLRHAIPLRSACLPKTGQSLRTPYPKISPLAYSSPSPLIAQSRGSSVVGQPPNRFRGAEEPGTAARSSTTSVEFVRIV